MDTSPPNRPKFRSSIYFFGIALIAGILCNLLLFRFYSPSSTHHTYVDTNMINGPSEGRVQCHIPLGRLSSDSSDVPWQPLPERPMKELRDMVTTTKGFYVRDWTLDLDWNEIRDTLETSIHHAQLLNRTLVIPSFVYSHACEYDIHICESFAVMVNQNDIIATDEWRKSSLQGKVSWRIPIEIMIDIPRLWSLHPIMFVSEYLRLRGVTNATIESSSGHWGGEDYHPGHYPSTHIIDSRDYEPSDTIRVDNYTPEPWVAADEYALRAHEALRERLESLGQPVMSLRDAALTVTSALTGTAIKDLVAVLKSAGWETLHTWSGGSKGENVKWVTKPHVNVAPRDSLRGFVQDYGSRSEEILYLKGEMDHHRKPGSMQFTTIESARRFASLVLHDVQAPHAVQDLAVRLIHRMDDLAGGRLWVSSHMSRGYIVSHNASWITDKILNKHMKGLREEIQRGYENLQYLHDVEHKTYNVPYPLVNELVQTREPPLNDDPFYLSTNERDPEAINYFKKNGAILFKDIISGKDRREFGWPLLFTDVITLVEQQIIGKGAAYFCRGFIDSDAGSVVNIRAAAGWDPRTAPAPDPWASRWWEIRVNRGKHRSPMSSPQEIESSLQL